MKGKISDTKKSLEHELFTIHHINVEHPVTPTSIWGLDGTWYYICICQKEGEKTPT